MNKSESIANIALALSKAQGQMKNALKASSNPFFKSKYADLAEVINTIRECLSDNEISYVQLPSYSNELIGTPIVSVETMLMHSSGEFISSSISCPVIKNDAQGIGLAISYCRRYSLSAIVGLAQEDDDGNYCSNNDNEYKAKSKKQEPYKNADKNTVAAINNAMSSVSSKGDKKIFSSDNVNGDSELPSWANKKEEYCIPVKWKESLETICKNIGYSKDNLNELIGVSVVDMSVENLNDSLFILSSALETMSNEASKGKAKDLLSLIEKQMKVY